MQRLDPLRSTVRSSFSIVSEALAFPFGGNVPLLQCTRKGNFSPFLRPSARAGMCPGGGKSPSPLPPPLQKASPEAHCMQVERGKDWCVCVCVWSIRGCFAEKAEADSTSPIPFHLPTKLHPLSKRHSPKIIRLPSFQKQYVLW